MAAVKKDAEKVSIELFQDNERYKDDVFAAVNGKAYKIRRGVRVEVPASVAEVLENSRKQDNRTAQLIRDKSREFAMESKKFNI